MTATAPAPTIVDSLLAKAKDRTAIFGVVGLGYVGLPLAMELVRAGYRVLGVDVNAKVVDLLNGGRSHIQDVPAATVAAAVNAKKFSATADLARLQEPDVISMLAATESVKRALRKGQLVVLESTTYPGTTRELMLPALESTGLKVGVDFFLAFSPERVDPGNERYNTRNTPKVIGGITPACLKVATALYQPAIDTLVPVPSPEAAEPVKSLENTLRSVNIGLVNEMAIVCDKLVVDVWEVIEAAATKPFGFMKFLPGPGLGGHCIPIDPHYLAWKMRGLNYKTRFIDLAGELNTEMPEFWVRKLVEALNSQGKAVRGASVLVLGVAYKRDIDDIRESPALDIIRLLRGQGARVTYSDPHVPRFREDGFEFTSVKLTPETVAAADCVMIVTDHTSVDYQMIKRRAKLVVDTRNALPKEG